MESKTWKHLYYEDISVKSRTVQILVDVITPQIMDDILASAYENTCLAVYIDCARPLPDGESIYGAEYICDDEWLVVTRKWADLGVSYGMFH